MGGQLRLARSALFRTRNMLGRAKNPSATMYRASDRTPQPGSPFTGGGITLPWGVTVDGDDTLWVLNFGATPPGPNNDPSLITGVQPLVWRRHDEVPAGLRHRRSDIAVDGLSKQRASANDGRRRRSFGELVGHEQLEDRCQPVQNPGGNAVVILIGAAAPLKTPGHRSAGAVPVTRGSRMPTDSRFLQETRDRADGYAAAFAFRPGAKGGT